MASAFSDSLMASEGWKHPTEISKTTKGMTMRFLPLVGTHMKAENQKRFFDIYGLVCKLQTEVQKIVIFVCNLQSRPSDFVPPHWYQHVVKIS